MAPVGDGGARRAIPIRAAGGALLLAAWVALGACAPRPSSGGSAGAAPTAGAGRPTPTAEVVAYVLRPHSLETPPVPAGTPTSALPGDYGIQETLRSYIPTADPEGSKADAYVTLQDFVNPGGPYAAAWWFADDGRADIYEALAVILYAEGAANYQVQRAVAARYIWFCGGAGTACSGDRLVNFLSYFHPWREPWTVRGGLAQPQAQAFLEIAKDVVQQRPGILTLWIPGADTFVHNPDGLDLASPVDWYSTPFHFANVHPTWDAYLRQRLRREPNGRGMLWVLTIGEADRACRSKFVCENMTLERIP